MKPLINPAWRASHAHPALPKKGELHLWLISLELAEDDYLPLLSPDELGRRVCLLSQQEKRRFTLARGSMRAILSTYLGIKPQQLIFSYGEKGKPSLKINSGDLRFNLSHAGNLALLAITQGLSVGVDLEPITERAQARRIAQRIFEPAIVSSLSQLDNDEYPLHFLAEWTGLESRVKAMGKGVFSSADEVSGVESRNFQPEEGWIASVAMEQALPAAKNWLSFRFPHRKSDHATALQKAETLRI